jgi:hypothetical protein
MPENEPGSPQGPSEGSRCVAGPGGRWGPATIRRVNEDGSFKVEFDVKEMLIMPYWYGVTSAEISFDDARQWASVFAQISRDGRSFAWTDFREGLAPLGYQFGPDQAQQLWDQGCRHLFGGPDVQTDNRVLDSAMSYQLFLYLGASAKQCAENLRPTKPKPHFKLYWNQTRMGGREPAEVGRRVSLDDALAALGLTVGRVDRSTVAFLQRFEREHGVRLPATMVELLQQNGVAAAVTDCHPNNPNLVEFKVGQWALRRDMRGQQLTGDYALVIMLPHQGDHEWAVVFDDGEDDARVYVRWDAEEGEAWLLTAPEIGMFFWDLAQTGLTWYQDTRFEGGKPVKRSDIGLILGS